MKRSIEYIETVVCAEEKITPDMLQINRRYWEVCFPRQLVMYFAMLFENSQTAAAEYYGKTHASAFNSRKSIQNFYDTNKEFREKIDRYYDIIKEGVMYKETDHLSNLIARLKREVGEITQQLNSIAI